MKVFYGIDVHRVAIWGLDIELNNNKGLTFELLACANSVLHAQSDVEFIHVVSGEHITGVEFLQDIHESHVQCPLKITSANNLILGALLQDEKRKTKEIDFYTVYLFTIDF